MKLGWTFFFLTYRQYYFVALNIIINYLFYSFSLNIILIKNLFLYTNYNWKSYNYAEANYFILNNKFLFFENLFQK